MANPSDIGPLDWRIGIVDKTGRPTPEFQRKWNAQRGNNGLIGSITTGSGVPVGVPSDGQAYIDISTTPYTFYIGFNGVWSIVGATAFIQLVDVPNSYSGAGNKLVHVNSGATGLEFKSLSDLLDLLGNSQGDIIYRSSSGWTVLAPGTAGDVLSTGGTGADPAWIAGGGGGGSGLFSGLISIPTLASTGLNAHSGGTIALTDTPIGINIAQSGNAFSWSGGVPTPPYSITVLGGQTAPNAFLSFGWSDGTKLQFLYLFTNGHVNVQSNDNYSTYNSTQYDSFWASYGSLTWFKIRDDGTNMYFMVSGDGINFTTVYSVAKASGFLGASGYSFIAVSGPASIMSWQQGT